MSRRLWLNPVGEKLFSRWGDLMDRMNVDAHVVTPAFEMLMVLYDQTGRSSYRHFHTLERIIDRLDLFDEARSAGVEVRLPNAAEMALWWQDALFDPRANGWNKIRSADLAQHVCTMMNCIEIAVTRLGINIEQTRHTGNPQGYPDTLLVLDIDLAWLGSDQETFNEYCRQIRKEHDFMSDLQYFANRLSFFRKFTKRPRLYYTDFFRSRCENQALENILRHIAEIKEAFR